MHTNGPEKGQIWYGCPRGTVWVDHYVAGVFMCRQPQQKSGSEQPRSNQHQHLAEAQNPLESFQTVFSHQGLVKHVTINVYVVTLPQRQRGME